MELAKILSEESDNFDDRLDDVLFYEKARKGPIDLIKTKAPNRMDTLVSTAAQGTRPKKAISRLKCPTVKTKSRASVACNHCRKAKIKCSGDQPSCMGCLALQKHCEYGQKKRDNIQRYHPDFTQGLGSFFILRFRNREVHRLSAEVQDYRAVLEKLQTRAHKDDFQLITSVLHKHTTTSKHVHHRQ